jgi:hypothetical protein
MSATAATCPHCDARRARRRRLGVVIGLAGSAGLGLTLMACYGAPCDPGTGGCHNRPDAGASTDGGGPDGGTAP